MLVLSRFPGQSILIGKDVEVVILGTEIGSNGQPQIRLGIKAPREVIVLRKELLSRESSQVATNATD